MIKVRARVNRTIKPAGRRFNRLLDVANGASVWVGLRAKSPREDAQLVIIAASNEFGTADGRVPERSFMRSTLHRRRNAYTARMGQALARAEDPLGLERELGQLGLMGVRDVQKTIASNLPPPNAPATVRQKGSSRTLIDTGRLRQSIDFEVILGR